MALLEVAVEQYKEKRRGVKRFLTFLINKNEKKPL